jgi:hypothetical protein
MESLLRWGIENSTVSPDGETAVPQRKDLDPAIIDLILGRPDAVLMKEALDIAVDEKQSIDARIQALDDFEMLVENIDNANGTSGKFFVIFHHDLFSKLRFVEAGDVATLAFAPDSIKYDGEHPDAHIVGDWDCYSE